MALPQLPLVPDTLPPHRAWQVVASALSGAAPVLVAPGGSGASPPRLGPCDVDLLNGAGLVMATSGSTGRPKWVVLDAEAMRASAQATTEYLGGPGQWLQTLALGYIAGWQVWARSIVSGIPPVLLPRNAQGFSVSDFVTATQHLEHRRRHYTALVPTQVHRLLNDPDGVLALQSFDRVLIGGAALPPSLASRIASYGIAAITTYGMTETCGGCLYNGTPLPGYAVRTAPDGTLMLSGPSVARGYLGQPDLTKSSFTTVDERRWFITNDLGQQSSTGWEVLGRADDVINTGAKKVLPAKVEAALLDLPGVTHACVVGVADAEWGQRVVAAIVSADAGEDSGVSAASGRLARTAEFRDRLRPALAPHELPREIAVVTQLPLSPRGKLDRLAVRRLFTG